MNEFDNELKRSLANNGPFDPEKARGMKKEIASQFNARLAKVERYLYIWLIGLAALLVFAAFRLLESTSTKALVVYAMMFLVALEGQTLIKLWYWMMNSKIGVLKELKLLRLDVAAIPGADKALSRMDVDELMAGPPRRIPGCGKVERIAWKIALYAVVIFVAFAGGCEFRIGGFHIGRQQPAAESQAPEPTAAAIPMDVRIDPRVELISIIFRLAGNREYSMCQIPSYNRDIEEHFGPYNDHPAIKFASELRQRRGVSFDAPMSLAVHLTDATGLGEKIPFDSPDEEIDSRWKLDELREFVEKARLFVKDADFEGFIDAHEELYAQTVARAKQMLKREAHLEWFDDFFGARPGDDFKVVIGMVNGPSNYGARMKLGDDEELYCILGVWNCDLQGIPRFPGGMVSTVVHEFCHSYVNPLVYARTSELEEAGTRMYETVKNTMKQMAYGNWTTMMHESVVRASGVRYTLSTRGKFAANMEIMGQVNRGFLWTRELSKLLGEYEANRDQYPTLESFFPRIITFFNEYSGELRPLHKANVGASSKNSPEE
jgi:hypothetical protein